jgi:3-dehydroquinate dehydratase-2
MPRVLIIQGAGMDQRGKTQIEIFGPATLPEINAGIEHAAVELGLDVEIIQSNDDAEIIDHLEGKPDYAAVIINPAGFTTTTSRLPEVLAALSCVTFEVHASNPASRGIRSTIGPACTGGICGFGYAGYAMALKAIQAQISPS